MIYSVQRQSNERVSSPLGERGVYKAYRTPSATSDPANTNRSSRCYSISKQTRTLFHPKLQDLSHHKVPRPSLPVGPLPYTSSRSSGS